MKNIDHTHEQPIVTVDVVLLTLCPSKVDGETRLHVALTKRTREPFLGVWSIPGGWVHTDVDQDDMDAAKRILSTKMGVQSPYLEQLKTFASKVRDARGWSVSIVYYALIPHDSLVKSDDLWVWRDVSDIGSLPFDHSVMLNTAIERLRSKSVYSSLPLYLMPKQFSLSDLQRVYEIVLNEPQDKRGFRRRIEQMDVIEEVPAHLVEKEDGKTGAPAAQYRLKTQAQKSLHFSAKPFNGKP